MRDQTIRHARLGACALFVMLLAACGGGTANTSGTTADAIDVAPVPPEPQATDYLPADTFAVLTLDVTRLRSSPYYPTVVEAFKSTDEMSAEEEELLHGLVERTSTVWAAVIPDDDGTGADLGVILVEGDYDPGQPEAALRSVVPNPDQLQPIEIAGHRALSGDGGTLAEIDARHWIIGPPERVRALLENPPGGFAAQNDPAWAEAQQWLQRPDAGITFVALGGPALHYELERESPMDAQTAASTRAVAFSLDADDGVSVEAMGLMGDHDVAAQVIQWVQRQIDQLGQSMVAGMLGLGPILQGIVAQAEGTVAGIRLNVPDAEVRRLLGLLPNLMNQ
ncbi:MAG: hypothetical protein JJ863_27425 [Deltaproteobacteria bacterium]|nr:hypothetical protein [Deltaproteobacteria bacterium]